MVLDIIAGVILLASILISILRGFVREVLTIFGLVGGTIAAYIGGPLLSPFVGTWIGVTDAAGEDGEAQNFLELIPYATLADALAYAGVFIVFVIILSLVSHLLSESIKEVGLGALDRTLGMVFGLARGVLFLGLIYLPVYYLVDEEQAQEWDWFQTSRSRVYFEATSGWISGFIPSKSLEELQEAGKEIGDMNEARKKLQDMDLLPVVLTPLLGAEALNDAEEKPSLKSGDTEGYSDNSREAMDVLIEETMETAE